MSDVFISHSSKDKKVADAICAILEQRSLRCWVAPRDIPPGVEWGEAILGGIESSRVMVLVFSSHSNESPQVRREVERAVSKGLVIIPFRIENVLPTKALEYFISAAHWLDAFTLPLQKHLENLEATISGILGQPVAKPAPVRGRNRKDSYTVKECAVLLTTAVVFAAMVFGGLYWLSKNGKDSPPVSAAHERPPKTAEPTPAKTASAIAAVDGTEETKAGDLRIFGGIEMVWCPPGEFLMGSPEDEVGRKGGETQHQVTLTWGFWLAKTETTQGQWEQVMGTSVTQQKIKGISYGDVNGQGALYPMYFLTWDDAQEFIEKMKLQQVLPMGWKWALPTEAQWEYACRAGTQTPFAGDVDDFAWYSENSEAKANPVGTKKANGWGLFDMHGNVWEWCADFPRDYAGGISDPVGSNYGSAPAFRGGGWRDNAIGCRSANRGSTRKWDSSGLRSDNVGFRVAVVPSE